MQIVTKTGSTIPSRGISYLPWVIKYRFERVKHFFEKDSFTKTTRGNIYTILKIIIVAEMKTRFIISKWNLNFICNRDSKSDVQRRKKEFSLWPVQCPVSGQHTIVCIHWLDRERSEAACRDKRSLLAVHAFRYQRRGWHNERRLE